MNDAFQEIMDLCRTIRPQGYVDISKEFEKRIISALWYREFQKSINLEYMEIAGVHKRKPDIPSSLDGTELMGVKINVKDEIT